MKRHAARSGRSEESLEDRNAQASSPEWSGAARSCRLQSQWDPQAGTAVVVHPRIAEEAGHMEVAVAVEEDNRRARHPGEGSLGPELVVVVVGRPVSNHVSLQLVYSVRNGVCKYKERKVLASQW